MTKRTDNRPIAGDPKLFLEELGYDIDEDPDQAGLWVWTAPSDGCDSSYDSAKEALEGAWIDAASHAMGISSISRAQWEAMDFDQQKAAILEVLSE